MMEAKDQTEDQQLTKTKTETEIKGKADYQEGHNKWRRESWTQSVIQKIKRIFPKIIEPRTRPART